MGPKLAGAAESALDFVVNEDGTDFVTASAEGGEERGSGDVDAAFTLDGLDEDAAGFGGYEIVEVGFDIVNAVDKTGDHRGKRLLVFGVRCCGKAAHSTAME